MSAELTPRQQEILDASLRVIDREGLKKFTMKNVAQSIGVTDAALYKHFPDKAAILESLARLFKSTTLDQLEEIRRTEGLTALEKLERFVKMRAQQFQSNRALTVALFSEELFRDLDALSSLNHDTMADHAEQMVALVRTGQANGEIRKDLPANHIVLLLTGPMRLMVTSWKSAPDDTPSLVDRISGFWTTYVKLVSSKTDEELTNDSLHVS